MESKLLSTLAVISTVSANYHCHLYYEFLSLGTSAPLCCTQRHLFCCRNSGPSGVKGVSHGCYVPVLCPISSRDGGTQGPKEQHPLSLWHIWAEWGRGLSKVLPSHSCTRLPLRFPVSTAVCLQNPSPIQTHILAFYQIPSHLFVSPCGCPAYPQDFSLMDEKPGDSHIFYVSWKPCLPIPWVSETMLYIH